MRCLRCGAYNAQSSSFCGSCAAKLPPPTAQRKGSGLALWLIGLVAFGGGGIVVAALLWLRTTSPQSGSVVCENGVCPPIDPTKGAQLSVHGTDRELGRIRIDVPARALSAPLTVRVSKPSDPLDLKVLVGPRASIAIGKSIRFEPSGTMFAEPLRVELPYHPKKRLKLPSKIRVAVLHRAAGKLALDTLEPDRVDEQAGIVVVSLKHFSDVVVVDQPDDPNAIKLDGTASGSGAGGDPPPPQWKITTGCEGLEGFTKRLRCGGTPVTDNREAFWNATGVDKENDGYFNNKCPLRPLALTSVTYRMCRLGTYLDSEDGGETNVKGGTLGLFVPVPPIRSGKEVELYNLIKQHMRAKKGPLTQEDLLDMAIQSVGGDGSANLQSALLTAHNLVRVLARPSFWQNDMQPKGGKPIDAQGRAILCPPDEPNCGVAEDSHTWGHGPDDPMYPIFLDAFGNKSTDGGSTLQDIMGQRGRLPTSWLGDRVYSGKDSIFSPPKGVKPEFSGGCYYYFWVGAVGASGGGSDLLVRAGIGTESAVKALGGESERGKAETACAYRGADLARCLGKAQRGELPIDCDPKIPPLSTRPTAIDPTSRIAVIDAGPRPPLVPVRVDAGARPVLSSTATPAPPPLSGGSCPTNSHLGKCPVFGECPAGFCCLECPTCMVSCIQQTCPPGARRGGDTVSCVCDPPKRATFNGQLVTSCK